MSEIAPLFVTKLYRAAVEGVDNRALLASCRAIAAEDEAGQAWSKEKGYRGYTSYASLNDLAKRDPNIHALKGVLDKHATKFARVLHLELGGRRLKLDSIWINVLEPGGAHTGHIHPHSVLSGTYYVETPPGASALKLEDPRLPLMMAAPPRREDAPESERSFVYVQPKAGDVLMWESFVRHEVPPNNAKKARVSISFNYSW
ncbi:MAG TPA: TIGR02466 family protein [Vitreimonas sp.]|uniref:TIGR02466 family protein n=1 Tax=Vitreimonas sp. TaxID=3069702 RepID=UPI002D7006B1|nr:TIGR02466 family protein [Vitreimonas sp.]HYD88139.1 TIGR02466 family protein [Vitreimonas sp.]